MKYSRKARLKVKFLVMDMNASYGQLLKTVFPNAEIVTDRFHIIQHINRFFNLLRIKEMNQLKRHDPIEAKQYRRLKRYWRLLLKDSSDLNYKRFYYRPLFKKNLSSTELVDDLLSYSSTLKIAYNYVQELKYAYRTKDSTLFLTLCSQVPEDLPKEFRVKFKIFNKFSQGIINAFKYPYSNGFLEGINNKIKVIKRVAYGDRNFLLFKRYILRFKIKSSKSYKKSERISSLASKIYFILNAFFINCFVHQHDLTESFFYAKNQYFFNAYNYRVYILINKVILCSKKEDECLFL